ncbi:hypothetical protein PILCRDRAFT_91919 [Piloderma croceum F 1598]|uniref:Uncharacterized protein n=1 Tax=Piloderma croceum (strain F 1598) TaxID=765440 RepID=A0A0C3BEP4_PILCF|nr:hypothetical protein PILCRDRAFT_91919 [Piloderma croceum F 1598]
MPKTSAQLESQQRWLRWPKIRKKRTGFEQQGIVKAHAGAKLNGMLQFYLHLEQRHAKIHPRNENARGSVPPFHSKLPMILPAPSQAQSPENLWEARFNKLLDNATRESKVAIDELFLELEEHACEGRDILTDVKYAGSGRCDEEYGVLMDLFVQGFKLVVCLTSEIKFFEVKLDEFAPATPIDSLSDV